eukprot:6068314-Prymnesium_polylepis.2
MAAGSGMAVTSSGSESKLSAWNAVMAAGTQNQPSGSARCTCGVAAVMRARSSMQARYVR